MLNDNIQNVDLPQPPQDSLALTIDEVRQENNRATSSIKLSTFCMLSSTCLTMSAIGAGCLASGHPLEGSILTGFASGFGIPCVKSLFNYSNILFSNQRINARENQVIEAPQDNVQQNNNVIENQVMAPRDTVNAMNISPRISDNSRQVSQLQADIVIARY
ncbi:MAG: hypothetical protein ACO26G_07275 [Rickettsiales bacterium]